MENHCVGVIGITHPYPNGQKFDTIAVVYDEKVNGNSVERDTYAVDGRTITKVYTNREPERTEAPQDGRFVIIEMDPQDQDASEMFEDPKTAKELPPGQPFSPALVLPLSYYKRPRAALRQTRPVSGADGTLFEPFDEPRGITYVKEDVIDGFVQRWAHGMGYNLFIPEKLEEGKQYPLVNFILDANPNGEDPHLSLVQGFGATGFATREIQEETPCFVLAVQVPSRTPLANDDFICSPEINDIKAILDDVVASYPIDKDRIYTTGQSQGCMTSCELNIRYPDFFAASLFVAGQWDADKMGKRCAGNHFWIVVSDGDEKAFPGMTAVVHSLEENGARVGRYSMNAKDPKEKQNAQILEAERDDVNVRFTVFRNHSVIPQGVPDNGGTNHVNTWPAAYGLIELRKWLVRQHK